MFIILFPLHFKDDCRTFLIIMIIYNENIILVLFPSLNY
jgi:hypothetical protein